MTERLADVWATRDYPVLLEVARRLDDGADIVMIHDLAPDMGMEDDVVARAATALERTGYVEVSGTDSGPWAFTGLRNRAYTVTGLHPDADEQLAGLVELLHQAADQSPDEEERSRLRRAADAVGNVSREVMVGVLTAYATKYGVH